VKIIRFPQAKPSSAAIPHRPIEAGLRVFADRGLTMSAMRQVADEIGV
jgi:hypothetical protein